MNSERLSGLGLEPVWTTSELAVYLGGALTVTAVEAGGPVAYTATATVCIGRLPIARRENRPLRPDTGLECQFSCRSGAILRQRVD